MKEYSFLLNRLIQIILRSFEGKIDIMMRLCVSVRIGQKLYKLCKISHYKRRDRVFKIDFRGLISSNVVRFFKLESL